MDHFTPLPSTIGGVLIGLSATFLLVFNGRVAGVSGIFSGVLFPKPGETMWRWAFLGGLVIGGLALSIVFPEMFAVTHDRSVWMIAAAGMIVGVGVSLGGGCTSGHGVCGISRLSLRSAVATLVFIATGAITVLLVRVLSGGAA